MNEADDMEPYCEDCHQVDSGPVNRCYICGVPRPSPVAVTAGPCDPGSYCLPEDVARQITVEVFPLAVYDLSDMERPELHVYHTLEELWKAQHEWLANHKKTVNATSQWLLDHLEDTPEERFKVWGQLKYILTVRGYEFMDYNRFCEQVGAVAKMIGAKLERIRSKYPPVGETK